MSDSKRKRSFNALYGIGMIAGAIIGLCNVDKFGAVEMGPIVCFGALIGGFVAGIIVTSLQASQDE